MDFHELNWLYHLPEHGCGSIHVRYNCIPAIRLRVEWLKHAMCREYLYELLSDIQLYIRVIAPDTHFAYHIVKRF
jgi:hypothetical protein